MGVSAQLTWATTFFADCVQDSFESDLLAGVIFEWALPPCILTVGKTQSCLIPGIICKEGGVGRDPGATWSQGQHSKWMDTHDGYRSVMFSNSLNIKLLQPLCLSIHATLTILPIFIELHLNSCHALSDFSGWQACALLRLLQHSCPCLKMDLERRFFCINRPHYCLTQTFSFFSSPCTNLMF